MNTQSGNAHLHNMWGEIALITAVTINSFGVVLMLYSAAGISAISSVPYAFSLVLPRLTLGTWTYIFQGVLILTLMIMRRKFVPQYLCSFIVGFVFGKMLDIHEMWIGGFANCPPMENPLLCDKLHFDMYRNRTVQQMWTSNHPDRPFPKRAV